MIPVGPYRPDMAETNSGVSARVVNVNPRRDGSGVSYHPRASLQVPGSAMALPGPPRGAVAVVSRSGQFKGYFGTADKLFELQPNYSFDEIGSGFSLPGMHDWSMCQYGDRLLSTNTSDGMRAFDIENGGAMVAVPGAPKARVIFTAFECIFALDCDGDSYLMRNSAVGNYANWVSGGAGAQEFPDGESLMGGGSLNDGTAAVLQRAAVHVLTVTGDARIYSKVKVADGIGAVSPRCIVQTPGALYFIHGGGFYRLTSAGLEPIGQDKINRTFLDRLGDDALQFVEGAYDPERRQVSWRYRAEGTSNELVYANILVFDLAINEFVEVEDLTSSLVRMSTPALSLEDLDQFGPLDDLPFSLDSDVWKGGRPRIAALDESYRLGFFDGPSLPAQIDTATLLGVRSMRVGSVMPITDAASMMVSVGARPRLADQPVWKAPAAMQRSGRVPLSGRGKALTMRAAIPSGANWSYFRGIDDLVFAEGGGR